MRLSSQMQVFIKEQVLAIRQDARVFLFGSRVDDDAKGGDIDILILCDPVLSFKERVQLEHDFKNRFGDQKIDFLCYEPDSDEAFKQMVIQHALAL